MNNFHCVASSLKSNVRQLCRSCVRADRATIRLFAVIAVMCFGVTACSEGNTQDPPRLGASKATPSNSANPPSIQLIKEIRPFDIDAWVANWQKRHEICLKARADRKGTPYNPREIIGEADARKIGSGAIEEYFQGDHYAIFETRYKAPFFDPDVDDCKYKEDMYRSAQIIRGCLTITVEERPEKRIVELESPPADCKIDRMRPHLPYLTTRKATVAGHECTFMDMSNQSGPAPCFLSANPVYVPVGNKKVIVMDDLETGKANGFGLAPTAVAKEVKIGVEIPLKKFEIPAYAAGYRRVKE